MEKLAIAEQGLPQVTISGIAEKVNSHHRHF